MYKSKGYKIVKHGDKWFVLNEHDNASMAKTLCLYRADTLLQCQNWVRKKKAWFKKDKVLMKIGDRKIKKTSQVEKLLEIGKRIGFYK